MSVRWQYVLEFYGTIGVPIVYALGLVAIARDQTLTLPVGAQLVGAIGAVLGLIIWILSYFHLSHSFGVLPRAQKRVTTGLYALLRHPMYIGISLTYIALSIANNSRAGIVYTFLLLIPLLILRAHYEDRLLKS